MKNIVVLLMVIVITLLIIPQGQPPLYLQPSSSEQTVLQRQSLFSQFVPLGLNISNHPPKKPTNPSPADHAVNIGLQPVLRVFVSDMDNNTMNVSFYDASAHSLIKRMNNVRNGTTTQIIWANRSYNTTYSWYVVANDSQVENISSTWQFTTIPVPIGQITLSISSRSLGVQAVIQNIGNASVENCSWSLSLESKRRIKPLNLTAHGLINLPTRDKTTIRALPFGYGRISVRVTATSPDAQPVTRTANGILLRYRVVFFTTA
jgi:hypothetical protein